MTERHNLEIKAQDLIKQNKFLEASDIYFSILKTDCSSYKAKIKRAYCLHKHATKEVKGGVLVAKDECNYDLENLNEAWGLVERLIIYDEASFDSQVTGIGASINASLFRYFWVNQDYTKAKKNLDKACEWYKKGAKTDYRNGEGYIICCHLKLCYFPEQTKDKKEIAFLISEEVKNIINLCQKEKNANEWIHAALAKCYWLQGNEKESSVHEKLFYEKCGGEQSKVDAYQASCNSILPIKEICKKTTY